MQESVGNDELGEISCSFDQVIVME